MINSSNSDTRILCAGEAMLELSLTQSADAQVKFAGDTLNTAVYLQRMCSDTATVSYCTVVGEDALSERLVNFIKSENIDVSTISRIPDRTIGLYAISTDEHGERSFTYWRNESAAKNLFQTNGRPDFSLLDQFEILYLSAITLAIIPAEVRQQLLEAINSLRSKKSLTLAFDSNYRPALWDSHSTAKSTIESFWKITDIALPSIDDEQALFNDPNEQSLLERFESYGMTQGALKRGAEGPIGLDQNNTTLAKEDLPVVKTIDTTAAGDSFNAGYLSALIQRKSQPAALLAGHECAARVITHRGAIIPRSEW